MNLESPKVTLQNNAAYLFTALCDVNNFEKLMPDSIAKFEVTDADSFIFGLKGMPEIVLQKNESEANSYVLLGAASDKLPFTLKGNIVNKGEDSTEVQLVFEGTFNAMMEMMIKTPITNFVNALSENLTKVAF